MTARRKSYFLVPNFNYSPGGPVALGDIIADAYFPAESLLARAPPLPDSSSEQAPEVYSATERGCRYMRSTHQSRALGASARFLQILKMGVEDDRARNIKQNLSCKEMRTEYILPSTEVLKARVADKDVSMVMKTRKGGGLGTRRSVYIITGLMIAKGLTIETEAGQEKVINAEAEIDAAALSGGAAPLSTTVKGSSTTGIQERATVEEVVGERILAYQLSRLQFKGFQEKKTDLEVSSHRKGAFYSIGEEGNEAERDTGVLEVLENLGSPGYSELEEEFDDELDVDTTDVDEGGDIYRYMSIKRRND